MNTHRLPGKTNAYYYLLSDLRHDMRKPFLHLRKPVFAYAKTKAQISCAVTARMISAFVFATCMVLYLYFLNPKCQASNPQPGLCRTWQEIYKTEFLMTRFILESGRRKYTRNV